MRRMSCSAYVAISHCYVFTKTSLYFALRTYDVQEAEYRCINERDRFQPLLLCFLRTRVARTERQHAAYKVHSGRAYASHGHDGSLCLLPAGQPISFSYTRVYRCAEYTQTPARTGEVPITGIRAVLICPS